MSEGFPRFPPRFNTSIEAVLLFDPFFLGERLTLRAVPIAARVVRGTLVAAVLTDVQMAAEYGGATLPDIGEHTTLRAAQVRGALECGAMRANAMGRKIVRMGFLSGSG